MLLSDTDITERSHKIEQIILQRLASAGQKPVAEALRTSESTISRLKGDTLDLITRLLAVLELKVVPVAVKCYRPADIEPFIVLAAQRMRDVRNAAQLACQDDEEWDT